MTDPSGAVHLSRFARVLLLQLLVNSPSRIHLRVQQHGPSVLLKELGRFVISSELEMTENRERNLHGRDLVLFPHIQLC